MAKIIQFRKNEETTVEEDLANIEEELNKEPIHRNSGQGGSCTETFGDRVSRIRESLDRINKLMSELKEMSAEANNGKKD